MNKTKNIIYRVVSRLINSDFLNLFSEEIKIKIRFKARTGLSLDFGNLKTYNEKLQWIKLNEFDETARNCADKYLVREYVKRRIGEQYLNELYAVYRSIDEIKIEKLPEQFVLKGTHGSGFNIIVEDKLKHNWNNEMKKMRRWLNTDYYRKKSEWVYKDLEPRIIAEKYIGSNKDGELLDYRFFCFDGDPKFITVDFNITDKAKTTRNLYDLEWNQIEAEIHYPSNKDVIVPKPEKLDEMIELSKKLSKGFRHVRVDFFNFDGKIIFGELTFFHQSGMADIRPYDFNVKMGEWLNIDKDEVIK